MIIARICSGGQSGVERGALDAARESGITICGWCPKDGRAEDCPVPPGVLESYPELRETPMANQKQKAEWNIRDSHVTVIIRPQNCISAGTDYAEKMCKEYNRPRFVARGMAEIPEVNHPPLVEVGTCKSPVD